MSLGGFGAGFAQTFDGAKFGRALNEGIADYREGKAIEAAEKKKALFRLFAAVLLFGHRSDS